MIRIVPVFERNLNIIFIRLVSIIRLIPKTTYENDIIIPDFSIEKKVNCFNVRKFDRISNEGIIETPIIKISITITIKSEIILKSLNILLSSI